VVVVAEFMETTQQPQADQAVVEPVVDLQQALPVPRGVVVVAVAEAKA
jgi:hypothetical protein